MIGAPGDTEEADCLLISPEAQDADQARCEETVSASTQAVVGRDVIPVKNDKKVSELPDLDLPMYDKAFGTRNACIAGLIFSWLLAITCISLGPWTFKAGRMYSEQGGGFAHDNAGERSFFLNNIEQELVKLAVNFCITLCVDCLGYIHSTALRWALWREHRLRFNSNLRLLANTEDCSSNRWSTNVVAAFLLMACYTASGQLFLPGNTYAAEDGLVLNGIAVIALGVGVLGQCIIATYTVWSSMSLIPTWSANPLNTVLVCLHGRLKPRANRCLRSVHDLDCPSVPVMPRKPQLSLAKAVSFTKLIRRGFWALFIGYVGWTTVIALIWSFERERSLTNGVPFYGGSVPILEQNLNALLIVLALQALLTLSLHSIELLVNMNRDEAVWRRATSRKGTRSNYGILGSIQAAAASWEVWFLVSLKSLAHWLSSIAITESQNILYMNWAGLLSLAGLLLAVGMFATYLTDKKLKGMQPATFGHLQTLADLVDCWSSDGTPMWWGDKGLRDSDSDDLVRKSGTAASPLIPVRDSSLYQ